MPFESFVGWRYLFRRRRGSMLLVVAIVGLLLAAVPLVLFPKATLLQIGPVVFSSALVASVACMLVFFSVLTSVAILGVGLGVCALVVVLSVTSGFEETFKDKVLGVNAHVMVMKFGVDFGEYRQLAEQIRKVEGARSVAPFVLTEVQVAKGPMQTTVLVKGIDTAGISEKKGQAAPSDANVQLDHLRKQISSGSLKNFAKGDSGIVLGHTLAEKLHAKVGDTVRVMPPLAAPELLPGLDGEGAEIKTTRARATMDLSVEAITDAGFDEYDRRLVYIDLADAQRLVGRGDVVSGLELRVAKPDDADRFARKLEHELQGKSYRIIDWSELNHNLFTALRLQKLVLSLFLTIIVVVAAFNIVASLTLLVVSKRREIAIVKSMGASNRGIARIFQVTGGTIGAMGTVLGLGLGLFLCTVARKHGYALDPRIYLIDTLPVHVRGSEVGWTVGITLVICLCATLYPASRASKLRPVEGLRRD